MKINRSFLLIAAALLLAGCETRGFPDYVTSRDTLFYLQQVDTPAVSVGPFVGGPPTLAASTKWDTLHGCFLKIDKDEGPATYQDFMRAALIEELSAAGLYAEASGGTTISGEVERLSFRPDGPLFEGAWTIGLLLTSSNGQQMRVAHEYEFDTGALVGPTVCGRAIETLAPAVQLLFQKAVMSPEFAKLVG